MPLSRKLHVFPCEAALRIWRRSGNSGFGHSLSQSASEIDATAVFTSMQHRDISACSCVSAPCRANAMHCGRSALASPDTLPGKIPAMSFKKSG